MDFASLVEKYDKERMREIFRSFPEHIKEALKIGNEFEIPDTGNIKNIVVQGMGGSGIGGFLLRDLLYKKVAIPILVNNSYAVPNFVDKNTLLIGVSFSGNTEETLAVVEKAKKREACVVTIGSKKFSENHIKLPDTGKQPRTMICYLFIPQIVLMEKLGFVDMENEIEGTSDFLRENMERFEENGKELAQKLKKVVPVVYASEGFGSIAYRFACDFAENAKIISSWGILPEINHNCLSAFGREQENLFFLFLRSGLESEKIRKRFEITEGFLSADKFTETELPGKTKLEQMFSGILISGFASYYLALLRGIDPTPIENSDALKERLSKIGFW